MKQQELIKCNKCLAMSKEQDINYCCDMLNAANLIAVCNQCLKDKKGGGK